MIDALVTKYIAIRDAKAKRKAKYEAEVAELTAAMDKIENHLLTKMQSQGLKSLPTTAGTAYIQHRSSASVADWQAYVNFIKTQDDPFAFVERRPNKTTLDEFRTANDDLPPGINWNESIVVNVKRS